ncbi:hypothetical protein [Streptomyces sp. B6B3]|uniref:hypothetical protein n=1 Tax=Streptomyces sp. B6B3 TaxID=3153570 RepID=UPI00325E6CB3
MNAEDLLRLIAENQDHVRESLTAEEFDALRQALAELARAGENEQDVRRALLDVRRALIPLPLDSRVRRAALDQPRHAAGQLNLAPERVLELLEVLDSLPDPRDVIAAARRRLLAEPSRSDAELDPVSAADPLAAGLIRLLDPERGPRYPEFQFAPRDGSPLPVVRQVNRLLLADQDPWGAADWWLGGNRWLGGAPARLIGQVPDALLAEAAQALVEGD